MRNPEDLSWIDDILNSDGSADDQPNKPNGAANGGLDSFSAAEIDMQALTWFWPGRFALGKIGIIAGLPDKGKGLICCFVAAAATAGVDFPCGEGRAPKGSVVWFNAEDDARDTIVPRLVAAGADLSRIHFIKPSRLASGETKMFALQNDLHLLRRKVEQIGDVVSVIFDPLSAYFGVGKTDARQSTDVRAVLSPLKDMTEELNILTLAILHFNKKSDVTSALLRISDSIAFTAAARHVYAVIDDPGEDKTILFVKVKNNLAPRDQKALRYGFGFNPRVGHDAARNEDIGAPYVEWSPEGVDISANDAMQAANGGSAYAQREAHDFLLDRLASGPVTADDILEEAKQAGIGQRTLYKVKKELKIVSKKHGGGWTWRLP